jgi:small subunit ribosomal protein S11
MIFNTHNMSDDKKDNLQPEEKSEIQPEQTIDPVVAELSERPGSKIAGDQVDESLVAITDEIRKKLDKKRQERDSKGTKKGKKVKKKKVPRKVTIGKAFIKATYNNTIITLTDMQGNVLSWASAGVAGFKGPKKSTPYAAQIITRLAVQKAREDFGLQEVSIFVRGVGTGRESAVRSLNSNGLIINNIKDITPIPHNGCRPKKPRRV